MKKTALCFYVLVFVFTACHAQNSYDNELVNAYNAVSGLSGFVRIPASDMYEYTQNIGFSVKKSMGIFHENACHRNKILKELDKISTSYLLIDYWKENGYVSRYYYKELSNKSNVVLLAGIGHGGGEMYLFLFFDVDKESFMNIVRKLKYNGKDGCHVAKKYGISLEQAFNKIANLSGFKSTTCREASQLTNLPLTKCKTIICTDVKQRVNVEAVLTQLPTVAELNEEITVDASYPYKECSYHYFIESNNECNSLLIFCVDEKQHLLLVVLCCGGEYGDYLQLHHDIEAPTEEALVEDAPVEESY